MRAPSPAPDAHAPKTDDGDEHWNAYAAINALNPAQVYRRKLTFELLALREASAPVRLIDLGSGSRELASTAAAS